MTIEIEGVGIVFLEKLAKDAGVMIQEHIGKIKEQIKQKSSAVDLVTEVDITVENMLKEKIKSVFPHHSFLCEESSQPDARLTDAPTWIMDPIDGTTNFVHSAPMACVSIAFAVKRQIVFGVVYNPMLEMLFKAIRGGGAYLNGQLLTLPKTDKHLNESLVSTACCVTYFRKLADDNKLDKPRLPADYRHKLEAIQGVVQHNVMEVLKSCHDLRSIGSCALNLGFVAAGYFDCYFELGIKEWDLAAGVLIVEEAGGHICRYDGSEIGDLHDREIIATGCECLKKEMVSFLKRPNFSMNDLEKF